MFLATISQKLIYDRGVCDHSNVPQVVIRNEIDTRSWYLQLTVTSHHIWSAIRGLWRSVSGMGKSGARNGPTNPPSSGFQRRSLRSWHIMPSRWIRSCIRPGMRSYRIFWKEVHCVETTLFSWSIRCHSGCISNSFTIEPEISSNIIQVATSRHPWLYSVGSLSPISGCSSIFLVKKFILGRFCPRKIAS